MLSVVHLFNNIHLFNSIPNIDWLELEYCTGGSAQSRLNVFWGPGPAELMGPLPHPFPSFPPSPLPFSPLPPLRSRPLKSS